jgi:membrane associated rhomboid family serine protease
MGIYDRDYIRERPRGGFGTFSFWSVSTWLIVINVGVFFADGILQRMSRPWYERVAMQVEEDGGEAVLPPDPYWWMGPLQRWGCFSTEKAILQGQVWRLVTFQFLHAGAGHLLMNMLGLFFFGPIVEGHFGGRRYLAYYLLCGLAGAASYLLLSALHVIIHSPATPLVGASAGVFGLLVAASLIAPDVEVFYYFIPVTIRTLAWVSMGLAAYTVLATGYNAGGQAAHLGGGVLGLLLMKNQHWLNLFAPSRPTATVRPSVRRSRRRTFQKDWSKDFNR